MHYHAKTSDHTIRGSCSLFVCRCCRTKFGWKHQDWCEIGFATEPVCTDCRYFNERCQKCVHPIKKSERGKPYEKGQRPL